MSENLERQILKEYGLEMLECMLDELAMIQGFERLIMVRHAYDFLVKECGAETTALLTDENRHAEYAALKDKLNTIAPAKKEHIKKILGIESITALLEDE